MLRGGERGDAGEERERGREEGKKHRAYTRAELRQTFLADSRRSFLPPALDIALGKSCRRVMKMFLPLPPSSCRLSVVERASIRLHSSLLNALRVSFVR